MYPEQTSSVLTCRRSAYGDYLERGSSAVECQTRNRGSLGLNTPLLPFQDLGIFVLSTPPQFAQLYK